MDTAEVKKCLNVPDEEVFDSMAKQDCMRDELADMDATLAEESKDNADPSRFSVRQPSIEQAGENEYAGEQGVQCIENKSRQSEVDNEEGLCLGMEYSESARRKSGNAIPVEDEVLDVSDKEWVFPLLDQFTSMEAEVMDRVNGLYVYNNVFTLIPESVGRFKSIKTLKVFSNEVNLFPSEVGDLVELEHLQVKVCPSGLGSLPPLEKLKTLKELELCKMPPRPSAFSLSSEISNLRSLTRLSVCHFSISFLPSEIGCLKKLEELDLSFNKLKTLPNDISELMALRSLKVASNKLVELPFGLSRLSNLATIDVSNNRLTSLQSLKLFSMRGLRALNAQHNKLHGLCRIPAWISCNLEGNDSLGKDIVDSELISSSSEEEVSDSHIHEKEVNHLPEGNSKMSSSSPSFENVSTIRCAVPFRMKKGWKRRDNQQQKARQERLNNSRKLRAEDHQESVKVEIVVDSASESSPVLNGGLYNQETAKATIKHPCKENELCSLAQDISNTEKDSGDVGCNTGTEIKSLILEQKQTGEGRVSSENSHNGKSFCCNDSGNTDSSKVNSDNCPDGEQNATSPDHLKENGRVGGNFCSDANKDVFPKPARRQGRCINNPKPSKRRRSAEEFSKASQKYSSESFCGVGDHLPDGFYDAGRDRPFKSLRNFEKESLCLDSREVILVDRERDEELDAIVLSAHQLISGLKQARQGGEENKRSGIDNFHRALLLALFVSDCFGGSDKTLNVTNMRRAVVGANVGMPFVCSCSVGSNSNVTMCSQQTLDSIAIPGVNILCENSIRIIKERRNSNVVPIGALHYGVCRHRAILLKYLCDRADPPIPCELIRGYMDYMPHAWNVILVNRGGIWVRMLVDACRPADIREEEDPEYFCRYIPLSRYHMPMSVSGDSIVAGNSGLCPCLCEEIGRGASGSVVHRCTLGQLTAAAKVRYLEASGASQEQQKNFEYNCLGEVRMLSALKEHPCIIDLYGHQLSSSWVSSSDGRGECQILQFMITMEYVRGGSLEAFLEKLVKEGKKCTPAKLAVFIARDVACALVELHSKHIIHRDIKSKNVLIDLEIKRSDESPLVKLCDFDRAVPLHSSVHTCCLAHHGVPPADVCVGTPRWMAPEMIRAMHRPHRYGLEVDMWSFGCLILELLTLQIPHSGLSDAEVHHCLQMERRPNLMPELDKIVLQSKDKVPARTEGIFPEEDLQILHVLVDLFYSCTESNPSCRPTAKQAYEMLSGISGPTPSSSLN